MLPEIEIAMGVTGGRGAKGMEGANNCPQCYIMQSEKNRNSQISVQLEIQEICAVCWNKISSIQCYTPI